MVSLHQISIPTPFNIGSVNCYLIAEEGDVTLVDPGPLTSEAYHVLKTELRTFDYSIADVESILITHPHIDHFGLARNVAEVSDAQVFAHRNSLFRLENPLEFFEREREFFAPFLVSMGLPKELVDTVIELPEAYQDLQRSVRVDQQVRDGNIINVGMELKVVHTPGHEPGSACFVSLEEDIAFTGDHVMMDISPNPLLTLEPNETDERTRSLPNYLSSLRKLRGTRVKKGYAGHREMISSLPDRITEIINHHECRKERIACIIANQGPLSAFRIMEDLFPKLPKTEMFPGLSEVIGHLDLLEDEDRVDIKNVDGVKQYSI